MGLSHAPRSRRGIRTPGQRARESRDAFVAVLRRLLKAKGSEQKITAERFSNQLLSLISTAEIARSRGAQLLRSHKNLRERNPDIFEQLQAHILQELESGSNASVILGSLREKARELSVTI